jgi:hypothetical protein
MTCKLFGAAQRGLNGPVIDGTTPVKKVVTMAAEVATCMLRQPAVLAASQRGLNGGPLVDGQPSDDASQEDAAGSGGDGGRSIVAPKQDRAAWRQLLKRRQGIEKGNEDLDRAATKIQVRRNLLLCTKWQWP